MEVGSLWVRLGIRPEEFTRGLKSAEMQVKGLEKEFEGLESFGQRFTDMGRGMTLGITLPLIGAGVAASKFAIDVVESENLFTVSMGSMAEAARGWSGQLNQSLGLNQYELRKNVGMFNVMFRSMELGTEAAYDMATGLTELAYDMASFYNLKADEAFDKLRSGITGEIEPLRRLGILVDENTVKTFAYTHGIAKQGEELSEQQKVMARYGAIMQQTSTAQGDLARTIESPANQIRILKSQVEELLVSFGQGLIPTVTDLTSRLYEGVKWFKGLNEETRSNIIATAGIAAAAGPTLLAIGTLIKLAGSARTSIAALTLAVRAFGMSLGPVGIALGLMGAALSFVAISRGRHKDAIDDELNSLKREGEILDISIIQTEKRISSIRSLGGHYVQLKKKVEEASRSDTESARIKAELTEIEVALKGAVGEEGMARILAANDARAAVNDELGLMETKLKEQKSALEETSRMENELALKKIEATYTRIKAVEKESKAYTFFGKVMAQVIEVSIMANKWVAELEEGISNRLDKWGFDSAAEKHRIYAQERWEVYKEQKKALEQLYDKERSKEIESLLGDFKELRGSLHFDESPASTGGLEKYTDSLNKLGNVTKGTAESTKDSRAAWEKTADILSTGLQTVQAKYDTAALAAHQHGNKVMELAEKATWLNQQLDIQKQIVTEVSKGYEENTQAKEKDEEATAKLALRLEQEKKVQVELEHQLHETRQAIKGQVEQFIDLAAEITNVEKKYREDLARALDEYREKVAAVNRKLADEEHQLTAEYESLVEQRARALMDFVDLFDAVASREVSGEQLLKNLHGQVEAFENWQESIHALAARGVDQGLIEELRQMGPKAGPEIAALNTLTDEQLREYVALWRQKNEEARAEAISQLQQQQVELQQRLMEIRAAAQEQLELYRIEWEHKNAEIRKNTDEEMKRIEQKFKDVAGAGTRYGVELISNFEKGMRSQFDSLRAAVEEARTIAEGLDPTVRHSPSLVDRVQLGLRQITQAYREMSVSLKNAAGGMSFLAPAALGPALAASYSTNNVNYVGHTFYINVTGSSAGDQADSLIRELARRGVRF